MSKNLPGLFKIVNLYDNKGMWKVLKHILVCLCAMVIIPLNFNNHCDESETVKAEVAKEASSHCHEHVDTTTSTKNEKESSKKSGCAMPCCHMAVTEIEAIEFVGGVVSTQMIQPLIIKSGNPKYISSSLDRPPQPRFV